MKKLSTSEMQEVIDCCTRPLLFIEKYSGLKLTDDQKKIASAILEDGKSINVNQLRRRVGSTTILMWCIIYQLLFVQNHTIGVVDIKMIGDHLLKSIKIELEKLPEYLKCTIRCSGNKIYMEEAMASLTLITTPNDLRGMAWGVIYVLDDQYPRYVEMLSVVTPYTQIINETFWSDRNYLNETVEIGRDYGSTNQE